eukprot:COSAG05_NODE_18077_length_314_cov_0.809302_1_plen_31_part_01
MIKAVSGRPIGLGTDEQMLVKMLSVRPVEVT